MDGLAICLVKRDSNDTIGWDCDRDTWRSFKDVLNDSLNNGYAKGLGSVKFRMSDQNDYWVLVSCSFRHDLDSSNPELTPLEYMSFIEHHRDALNNKWSLLLLRDMAEAYGVNWYEEKVPIDNPKECSVLYSYLVKVYKELHNTDELDDSLIVPSLIRAEVVG